MAKGQTMTMYARVSAPFGQKAQYWNLIIFTEGGGGNRYTEWSGQIRAADNGSAIKGLRRTREAIEMLGYHAVNFPRTVSDWTWEIEIEGSGPLTTF